MGYIVRPHYRLCRRRVVGNCREKLYRFSGAIMVRGQFENRCYTLYHLRPEVVHALRQTLASYLGHFRHAECGGLVASLFREFPILSHLFAVEGRYQLLSRLEPAEAPGSLRRQYEWFVTAFPGCAVFFQVGNHCELYGSQAERYADACRLRLRAVGRRGMGLETGFPVAILAGIKRRALKLGIPYVVVAEQGALAHIKRRVVSEWLVSVTDLWPGV